MPRHSMTRRAPRRSARRSATPSDDLLSWYEAASRALDLGHAETRQLVCALVLGMARVAFHPMPFDVVPLARRVEPLPELGILDRLLVRRLPAVSLPAVN